MLTVRGRFIAAAFVAAFVCNGMIGSLLAKPEKWKAPDGKEFSAEASDIIGPFLVFGGTGVGARRVPMHFFSTEDCIRFAERLAKKPERSADWSQSRSAVGRDFGRVEKVVDRKLQPFSVAGRREPLLYLVFYASASVGESWGFVGGASGKYGELKAQFGDEIEFVLAGVNNRRPDQIKMMVDMGVPFLSLDGDAVSSTFALAKLAGPPPLALLLSRDGTVLGAANNPDTLNKLYADIADLLHFHQITDVRGWKDRLYYHRIVQQALHAKDAAGPMLIGDPFDVARLKAAGVSGFRAELGLDAEGTVTTVTVTADPKLSEKLEASIVAAFKKALFVPAVKEGQFVSGTYTYTFHL